MRDATQMNGSAERDIEELARRLAVETIAWGTGTSREHAGRVLAEKRPGVFWKGVAAEALRWMDAAVEEFSRRMVTEGTVADGVEAAGGENRRVH